MYNILLKILLVEDNPNDAFLIQQMQTESRILQGAWTHVEGLTKAFQQLQHHAFDIVLLDLSLPDSHGLEALITMHQCYPSLPIVILTGLDDEQVAIRVVQKGAQDYLVKGQVTADNLFRALHYAIERQKVEDSLQQQTLKLESLNQKLQQRTTQLESRTIQLELTNQKLRQRTGQLAAANA